MYSLGLSFNHLPSQLSFTFSLSVCLQYNFLILTAFFGFQLQIYLLRLAMSLESNIFRQYISTDTKKVAQYTERFMDFGKLNFPMVVWV